MPYQYYQYVKPDHQLNFLETLGLPDFPSWLMTPSNTTLMASHSGKVTIRHSKFWWEAGRRFEKPCHDIPSMVFFKLPYGWFSLFKTLSANFDWYSREMVYWTSTTLVCGFWLIGNCISYTLSVSYSLWNRYWSLNFSAIEHLHPQIRSYPWVDKVEKTY